eukprot:TRINITY_DN27775_c0_g1_i2.p1 TRINITY_DN27775_c0_g1~~TRINITY_DN27775_c0_g1_i2.p1  ORF type:complete len:774 (-),score=144.86 TRINITY_DN27775_c0_g1_i2:15-2336(-)
MAATAGHADAMLERQAEEMAEKTLSALPPGPAKTAKMQVVKAGILKRLLSTAAATPARAEQAIHPKSPAPPPPPPPSKGKAGGTNSAGASSGTPVDLDGIELLGDSPWYADSDLRQRLLEEVRQAHAEEKILVASPADEIRRISQGLGGTGHVLGAGAVLRLGGAHHGGYGEADIKHAYRQLSRALHPDKNPGVPEAPDAFKRLGEAAEELQSGLSETRSMLKILSGATLGAAVTQEALERPQGPLLAEASRLLAAVLGLSGEGTISDAALKRAPSALLANAAFAGCRVNELMTRWYEESQLLDLFAGTPLRVAYDCCKQPFRMQFLCAMGRAADAEAERNDTCVRSGWEKVTLQFPELGLWRELLYKLHARVWTTGTEDIRSRKSKWDDKSESESASDWGKKWRAVIKAVLPRDSGEAGFACAVKFDDSELQKLCIALWKDIAAWAVGEGNLERHVSLFRSALSGKDSSWAFIPATDILLLIGEGLVGCFAEGFCVKADEGHVRKSFVEALKHWRAGLKDKKAAPQVVSTDSNRRKMEERNDDGKKRLKSDDGKKDVAVAACQDEQAPKLSRSPTRVLMVTNLSSLDAAEDDVKARAQELFAKFGKIISCVVIKLPEAPEKEAVRAFLEFEKLQHSTKAYSSMNGQYIDGRPIKTRFYNEARFAQGDWHKSAPTKVLLLTNVVGPGDADEGLKEELHDEVRAFGKLLRCVIAEKPELGVEEAVRAFLEFTCTEDCSKAFSHFVGRRFGDHRVKARYYNEANFAQGDLWHQPQ